MSAFGIFALILTTAYIIYFAVTISRDVVAGRKKAEDSPESETFEISSSAQEDVETSINKLKDSLQHEDSVAVVETEDGGFIVGDIEFDNLLAPSSSSGISSHLVPTSSSEEEQHEDLSKKSQALEDAIDNISMGLKDYSDKLEHELSVPSDQLEEYLLNQQSNSNSHLVNKIDVAAEEPLESEADDGPELQTEQEEERDRM